MRILIETFSRVLIIVVVIYVLAKNGMHGLSGTLSAGILFLWACLPIYDSFMQDYRKSKLMKFNESILKQKKFTK